MTRVLFRLWIIATVLWCTTVIVMGVIIWPKPDAGNYVLWSSDVIDVREGTSSSSAENLLAGPGIVIHVTEFGKFRTSGGVPTEKEEAAILAEMQRRQSLVAEIVSEARYKMFGILSGTLVLAPLVVLAFGASLVWAFRGYKKQRNG